MMWLALVLMTVAWLLALADVLHWRKAYRRSSELTDEALAGWKDCAERLRRAGEVVQSYERREQLLRHAVANKRRAESSPS